MLRKGIFKGMSHDAPVATPDEHHLVVHCSVIANVFDVDNDLAYCKGM
jgi:hypothetical protein